MTISLIVHGENNEHEYLKELLAKYGQRVTVIEVVKPAGSADWKVFFYLKDGTKITELTERFSMKMMAERFANKMKQTLETIQE